METEDKTQKEIYIPLEKRKQIIDELRLISYINKMEYHKNNKFKRQ